MDYTSRVPISILCAVCCMSVAHGGYIWMPIRSEALEMISIHLMLTVPKERCNPSTRQNYTPSLRQAEPADQAQTLAKKEDRKLAGD